MPSFIGINASKKSGGAVSQSAPPMSGTGSGAGDFKNTFDFDGGVPGKGGHSDRGARVPSPVAKNLDHKIRGAVHYFGAVNETCVRSDEHNTKREPRDLVEI